MKIKEKVKNYSDGRLSIRYPSRMKFKCYKKGGSYNLRIDRDTFISIALFASDCTEDLIQQTKDCRTYDEGMTKISYMGEMNFGNNTAIISLIMHHKMDDTFIGKSYQMIMTSVKTCCMSIEISGFREFDIMDYADILGSIRVEGKNKGEK